MRSSNVEVRDFSIVVVAENQNPSILNPDFLKYNQIVPPEWELAMPPICTPAVSQVVFKNGVNVVAQSDRVSFWEALDTEHLDFKVPEISCKYIDVVPSVDYRAVGININAHLIIENKEDNQDIILDKLIASGKWKSFQGKSPNAVVQFNYKLENDTNLMIAIQEVVIQNNNSDLVNIINFSANFNRELTNGTVPERISYMKNIIQSWKNDFDNFISFVEETFLE